MMSSSLLSQQVATALQRSLEDSVAEPEATGGSGNNGSGNDSDASAMTCSICLQRPALEQIASVKGCDHAYCVKCILRWAAHREDATCPQCKFPFDTVTTYYQLDGSLWDFPHEESVVLLKRAHWFTDYMQEVEKGGCWRMGADDGASGFADYDPYYQEFDDDEEVEDYYFSAAAGRARIVLGNRRHGENGFMASGRQQARPARQSASSGRKKKGGTSTTATPSPAPTAAARGAGRNTCAPSQPSPTATVADDAASSVNDCGTWGRHRPASAGKIAGNGGNEVLPGPAAAADPDRLVAPRPGFDVVPAAANNNRLVAESSSSRSIPARSNRRRGGVPSSSSYRSSQQQSSEGCRYGTIADEEASPGGAESTPSGSSPFGSSPGYGSSRGTGRRAKRNLRRTLDDEMAALHT